MTGSFDSEQSKHKSYGIIFLIYETTVLDQQACTHDILYKNLSLN